MASCLSAQENLTIYPVTLTSLATWPRKSLAPPLPIHTENANPKPQRSRRRPIHTTTMRPLASPFSRLKDKNSNNQNPNTNPPPPTPSNPTSPPQTLPQQQQSSPAPPGAGVQSAVITNSACCAVGALRAGGERRFCFDLRWGVGGESCFWEVEVGLSLWMHVWLRLAYFFFLFFPPFFVGVEFGLCVALNLWYREVCAYLVTGHRLASF